MIRNGIVSFALALYIAAALPAQSQILATGDARTCTEQSGDVAIEACTRAIASGQFSGTNLRLSPGDAQAFYNRALVYYRKRDADRAIADYSEAIKLDPAYAVAFVNRGIAHITQKDYGRALADLNEGIRLNPKDAIAFVQRARIHAAKKEIDRAIADYNEAIRLNPSYAERLAAERNAAIAAARKR